MVTLVILTILSINLAISSTSGTQKYAGFRSSRVMPGKFPKPEYWSKVCNSMADKFDKASPAGVWIVSTYYGNGECHLHFPNPGDKNYKNISFSSYDKNEPYLDRFDTTGVKVWLQVESGDADIDTLIDLVMERYGDHECVIGFGVDAEWFYNSEENNNTGRAITNKEAQRWEKHTREYDQDYTLTLKHWESSHMPPDYRGDIVFINDSQDFPDLQSMVNEFKNWGNYFSDNPVIYQFGYDNDVTGDDKTDKDWWGDFDDPVQKIGQKLFKEIDNCLGIYWVDFTIKDVFPPEQVLRDYTNISIEDSKIVKGKHDSVEVNLGLQYGAATDSVYIKLSGFKNKIKFNDIVSKNTIIEEANWSKKTSDRENGLVIEMGGSSITTSGILCKFDFTAIGESDSNVNIEIDSVYISNTDSIKTSSGKIEITKSEEDIIDRIAGFQSKGVFSDNDTSNPEIWSEQFQFVTSNFKNTTPAVSWKVCKYLENGNVKVSFPKPDSKEYDNITFSQKDRNQKYFEHFSEQGIKIWLQLEPGDVEVSKLINLVLNQYDSYSSIMGVGISVEYVDHGSNNSSGQVISDSLAQKWESEVKKHDQNYSLSLMHWDDGNMPPNYRGDIIFINNSSDLEDLDAMVSEFKSWSNVLAPNRVAFQVGYDADWSGDGKTDRDWWSTYDNPVKTIGDRFFSEMDNCFGVYWIENTKKIMLPDTVKTGINKNDFTNNYRLYDNYPNPFNSVTNINFEVKKTSQVSLNLYNIKGQKVKTLINSRIRKGKHNYKCDLSGLPSGVYFYRIKADHYTKCKKLIFLK